MAEALHARRGLRWIRRQQRARPETDWYWLALDKTTGQPVGQAGLLRQELDGVVETGIGYILHRPFWGQGYATEAAVGCRDYAYGKLGKARVTATVRPENLPSRRVAERIGLSFERLTTWADLPHMLYSAARSVCRTRSSLVSPGPRASSFMENRTGGLNHRPGRRQ